MEIGFLQFLIKITGLALVDAVNPCAIAVMSMILVSMLLIDPTKRKKVLYGGLAFSAAVFILYFLYGFIMVQFFSHIIPETGDYARYVFLGFGILAILLGLFNLKDFLFYSPGSVGTEMPLKLRPKVKALIKKINSPKGAFVIGLIVTLFLLPCTIGPYIIASVELSKLNSFEIFWWLLYYNTIFIITMIAITLIIYLGVTTVQKVSGWKEKNIRYLHLIEAIILIALGILMVTGILI
jgi:cytochrome c biogenesis protein CcdA